MTSNDNGGGLHYRYDREERLAHRPDRWEPSGGIFKRNRSLTIILIDVLIVLMLFGIFRLFVFGGDGPPQLRGYTVDLDVLDTSQGVLAIITLEAGEDPEESSGIVTVRFRPDGGEAVEVKDLLPEPGGRRRISELFPGATASVTATVEIDEDALELERAVESEAEGSDADEPGAQSSGTKSSGTEAPGAETSGTEAPAAETSGTETSGAETPGTETSGAETPGTETSETESG